jgi:hypothetical protein
MNDDAPGSRTLLRNLLDLGEIISSIHDRVLAGHPPLEAVAITLRGASRTRPIDIRPSEPPSPTRGQRFGSSIPASPTGRAEDVFCLHGRLRSKCASQNCHKVSRANHKKAGT